LSATNDETFVRRERAERNGWTFTKTAGHVYPIVARRDGHYLKGKTWADILDSVEAIEARRLYDAVYAP
jgi:hypothetical protein